MDCVVWLFTFYAAVMMLRVAADRNFGHCVV